MFLRTRTYRLYLAACVLAVAHPTFGMEVSTWRACAACVHLNLSMGLGGATHDHQVVGMPVLQKADKHYLCNPAEPQVLYLIRWLDQSYVRLRTYDPPAQIARYATKRPVSTFKGKGRSVPITASLHLDVLQKLRMELGTHLLVNNLRRLKHVERHQRVGDYIVPRGIHYVVQPWMGLGFKLFENAAYACLVDSYVGLDFLYGRLSDPKAVYPPGIPLGLGVKLERHISAYFSGFARLCYTTQRAFTLFPGKRGGVLWEQQRLKVQGGVSLHLPEIPRCPIGNCSVQVKHSHGRKAYRGASMYQGKNARGERLR